MSDLQPFDGTTDDFRARAVTLHRLCQRPLASIRTFEGAHRIVEMLADRDTPFGKMRP